MSKIKRYAQSQTFGGPSPQNIDFFDGILGSGTVIKTLDLIVEAKRVDDSPDTSLIANYDISGIVRCNVKFKTFNDYLVSNTASATGHYLENIMDCEYFETILAQYYDYMNNAFPIVNASSMDQRVINQLRLRKRFEVDYEITNGDEAITFQTIAGLVNTGVASMYIEVERRKV